jgi:hypothetical protein
MEVCVAKATIWFEFCDGAFSNTAMVPKYTRRPISMLCLHNTAYYILLRTSLCIASGKRCDIDLFYQPKLVMLKYVLEDPWLM